MSLTRERRGVLLLSHARSSLALALGSSAEVLSEPLSCEERAWLDEPAATFVTLRRGGALRGCIGTIEPRRGLIDDVESNARKAAFEDPRFPPVTTEELPALQLEISLLSPLEAATFASAEDARNGLRPGVDGVVLECGARRSTYLPQVWDTLPTPAEFLASLLHKAGLPRDFWSPDLRLWRYTVEKWAESEPGEATDVTLGTEKVISA